MTVYTKVFSLFSLLVLATAAFVMSADTVRNETVIWNFVNGIRIAGTTFLSGTATAPVIGSTSATSVTILADGSQTADLVVPTNSIGGGEVSGSHFDLVFCGQADENGTIYLSPQAGVNLATLGDGGIHNLASTVCDGLDGATPATQDLVLFPLTAFKVMGFYCMTNGTLGASETLTMSVWVADAAVVPDLTCTMIEAQQSCKVLTGTTTNVAAGAAIAMKAVEVSNNSDDDIWCNVSIMLQ